MGNRAQSRRRPVNNRGVAGSLHDLLRLRNSAQRRSGGLPRAISAQACDTLPALPAGRGASTAIASSPYADGTADP